MNRWRRDGIIREKNGIAHIFGSLVPGDSDLGQSAGWALLDQGLYAGTNFGLTIILARSLTVQDFGLFTTALSVLLVVGTFHTAFLTEPMLVFGPARENTNRPSYFGVLTWGHVVFSGTAAGLLLAATMILTGPMRRAVILVAILAPTYLLLQMVRRGFYSDLRPRRAAVASFLYSVLLVAGIISVSVLHGLDAFLAVLLMSIFALIVGSGGLRFIRPSVTAVDLDDAREVVRDHWRYGRWALPTLMINWVPWNLHFIVLASSSLTDVAAIRAVAVLTLPVTSALVALSTVLLPVLSGARASSDWPTFSKLVGTVRGWFLVVSCGYAVLLLLAGEWAVSVLYGGKYDTVANLAPLMGLIQVPLAMIMVFGVVYRSHERSDRALVNYLPYAVLTVALGFAGYQVAGVSGLVAGFLAAAVIGFGIAANLYRNWDHKTV